MIFAFMGRDVFVTRPPQQVCTQERAMSKRIGHAGLGIRLHGRGGQGAVVASKILAKAYFKQGLYVQAFPAFGMERRGAPVAAYVRVHTEPILARGEVTHPDVCVVLDPKLLELIDITKDLAPRAMIILNYADPTATPKFQGVRIIASVNATEIALDNGLGSSLAPIVNTVILGAYAKVVGQIPLELDNLLQAIEEVIPSKQEKNILAARQAFERATVLEER
jgi:pyruvate ferredoxin oxidoreductase gamma subunit/2-oxoisovalerate ferredoxin oxidoreductase gamma subunit